jgi:hypothetical protein
MPVQTALPSVPRMVGDAVWASPRMGIMAPILLAEIPTAVLCRIMVGEPRRAAENTT